MRPAPSAPGAARWRAFAAAALIACLAGAVAGCGSLPTNVGKTDTLRAAAQPREPAGQDREGLVAARPSRPAFACCRSAPTRSTRGSSSRSARRRSLDVQYYLLENDATGRLLMRALRDAALRGVRVRLLVDDLYTDPSRIRCCAAWRRFPTSRCASSTRSAAPRAAASAPRYAASLVDFGRLNHRMHNKLFIADGVMAVVGGRNIADEYFLRSGAQNFVDMDAFIDGRGGRVAGSDLRPLLEQRGRLSDRGRSASRLGDRRRARRGFDAMLGRRAARRRRSTCRRPTCSATARSPRSSTPASSASTGASARAFADPPEKLLDDDAEDRASR